MSATDRRPLRRLTVVDIAKLYADGERIPMLTAYDFPTAQLLDEAGIPLLLVGDSLGQVMLGYETTVRVTMAEMLHHTKAVVRGTQARAGRRPTCRSCPTPTPDEALDNAGRFLREAGAQAVKVEGGVRSARIIETLVRAGHPGHGPHRPDAAGDQRDRQGPRPGQDAATRRARCSPTRWRSRRPARSRSSSSSSRSSSRRRSPSGCASRRSASAPGAGCSGQVQVITDLLGLGDFVPRHARPYADLRETILEAARGLRRRRRGGHVPRRRPRPCGWTTRCWTRCSAAAPPDRPAGAIPVGGIPLDRDL